MDNPSRQHPPGAAVPADAPARRRAARSRAARSRADRDLAARLLAAAKSGADVRGAKVGRVKAAIRDGAYENDLKLEVAVQRLQDRVGEEAALLAELQDPPKQGRAGERP